MKSELRTEFGGYAPGQLLNFTVIIDNESDRDIDECSVEIVQKISFQSESPHHKIRTIKNVLGSKSLEGAKRFCKKMHEGSFRIAPLPPSSVGSDDIIKVYYYLRAEIETGCFRTNEVLHAGFTVGTVPLYASATNPNSVITVQPTAPVDNISGDDGTDMPPQYGSVVPPTFVEATGMNKPFVDADVDEHRVLDPYVPKYPVNNNFATPSAPGSEQMPLSKEAEAQQFSFQSEASAPPALPTSVPSSSHRLPYAIANLPVPGTAARVTGSVE